MLAHVVRENTAQRGIGIDNGSEWSNGTVHFDRTGPTEKSGPPREVGRSFRHFSGWTEPFHSVLDRHFRKFWLNGKRTMSQLTKRLSVSEWLGCPTDILEVTGSNPVWDSDFLFASLDFRSLCS